MRFPGIVGASFGAALGLAACGFRLVGSEPLPGILARPYLSVRDPYTDFAREFEHQLKARARSFRTFGQNRPRPST